MGPAENEVQISFGTVTLTARLMFWHIHRMNLRLLVYSIVRPSVLCTFVTKIGDSTVFF